MSAGTWHCNGWTFIIARVLYCARYTQCTNDYDVDAFVHVSDFKEGGNSHLFEAPLDLWNDINVCSYDVFAVVCIAPHIMNIRVVTWSNTRRKYDKYKLNWSV